MPNKNADKVASLKNWQGDKMTYKPVTLKNGQVAINEMCSCGHLRTEHKDNVYSKEVKAEGHGNCKKCDCKRFTWTGFVFDK